MSTLAVNRSEQSVVPQTQAEQQDARLKQACQQLEAIFWQQILQQMRKTIPSGGMLGATCARDLYTGLLDEQYALLLAGQDGSGLGRILYEQLRSTAGKAHP